jgi:hypothetical protein
LGYIAISSSIKAKGGPQYLVSAIFLIKISKGKIGTANPQFFASVIRLD